VDLQFSNTASPRRFSLTIGDPFTVRDAPKGEYFIHPWLSHLANGRLLLMLNRDTDIMDMEYCVLTSGDGGNSWESMPGWPMGDGAGRHLRSEHVSLPDGRSFVASRFLVATGGKNEYILPAWISTADGESWSRIEPTPFEFPFGYSGDFSEPSTSLFGMYREKPTELMKGFFKEFGSRWMVGLLWHLHPLDESTLLAFVYASTHPQRPGPRYVTVCLQSHDFGQSWSVRSVPGPYDPAHEAINRHKKPVDGLCEPSVTRLRNGDHFLVMRMGAWKGLYTARSADGCRTWTRPRPISVFGILPTVLTLPDGVLALASGRPDNTLSFSLDDGESWPWTYRLLDQTDTLHPSTRNSTLIQVEPNRLLYLYDRGYRRPDPEVHVTHGVDGTFIKIEAAP
jgi:hypothetical protein